MKLGIFNLDDKVYYRDTIWQVADHRKGEYLLWMKNDAGKVIAEIEDWIPENELSAVETRDYMVFWFYEANHGWETVNATSKYEAMTKSTWSSRNDIMKVAVRYEHTYTRDMSSAGMNLLKDKLI